MSNLQKGLRASYVIVSGFALLNVVMYILISKFWIGGSSFLPMIGKMGSNNDNAFLFSFIVNIGLIVGAFIGARVSGEFRFRVPNLRDIPRGMIGGVLIGIGVTLCPGTCTTAFVTGMPMLSVSSFLSATGIFIGAFIMHKFLWSAR